MNSPKRIKMTMGIAVLFVFLTASFASAEILEEIGTLEELCGYLRLGAGHNWGCQG